MRPKTMIVSFLVMAVFINVLATSGTKVKQTRRITRQSLSDKIRGGWAGQMIGVSYGAPTEFKSNGKIIEGDLNGFMKWSPDRLKKLFEN